jgi:hypothetical protein
MTISTARKPWFAGEDPLALHEVPAEIPPRRDGDRISLATVYRWTLAGCCGIRLRRYKAGPRGYATTRQELQRFQQALSAICGEDA